MNSERAGTGDVGLTLELLAIAVGCAGMGLATVGTSVRWIDRNYRRAEGLRIVLAGAGFVLVISGVLCLAVPGRAHVSTPFAQVSALVLLGCGLAAPILQRRPQVSLRPRRVLAIGAHPDDLELACGATLAKLVDGGGQVCTVVLSRGASGGDPSLRTREAARAADYLGAMASQVLDFCDTELESQENEMVQALERVIKEFRPDIVLTHSANDFHQDHAAVHRATMRAARRQPSILCYESPSATPSFAPVFYTDVSAYMDVKAHAIQLHADQSGKPYMGADRARGVAAFRGHQARLTLAEGFEVMRLDAASVGDL